MNIKSNKIFYLGIEGGGTKSTAILADKDMKILVQRKGKALNYHAIGEEKVKSNLVNLISPLLRKAEGGKTYTVLGAAGLDSPKGKNFYTRLIRLVLPKGAVYEVVNDSKIALEVRCRGEKNRIVVISGTGSNVYGESGNNSARSIGWDFVLGDEGSGYDASLKALRAAIHAWDGRGEKTILNELVLKNSKVRSMEEFIPKLYKDLLDKKMNLKYYIASFAPIIDRAIEQNDQVAIGIRDQLVPELVIGVQAVADRLSITSKKFCVGTMGSMWNMPGLEEAFKQQVRKHFTKVYFSDNRDFGAFGAILLAKKLKSRNT